MANFNLVVNTSNFKPFTYEEMVRPLLLYKQEEEARQQAYLDLQEKASTLEDLAASEKDAEAYGAYTAYKNRLREVADAMAKNGLTRQNNQVFNLRKSYINDIKPLNDLLEKRNKLVEEQRANNKDGTNIYSIDYGDMSLAEMKRNPTQTYNTLNGNVIRAMSAETFAPLAKQILESPEYTSILGKQYFQERIQRGYTLDQMINELQGTEAGSKLAQVKQNILSSLGMDKKGFSTAKQAQVEQFVNMGAMAALGETEYGNLNDKSYLDPLQQEQERSMAQSRAQSAAEFNFKYTRDSSGHITGINPAYIAAHSSEGSGGGGGGNGNTVNHPGSQNDIYTSGTSGDFDHIGNEVSAGTVPVSTRARYDGIDDVHYYPIIDLEGDTIGHRVVAPHSGGGGYSSEEVSDADGE